MQLTSGAAVPVRRAALIAFRATVGVEMPWEKPGLSRSRRVEIFIENLLVTSGPDAGRKLKLRPFQRQFIRAVYKENRSGKRPIRTAVLSTPRKQGKTCLAAAIALCHLCGPEREPQGECVSAANDRFQAGKIFSEMYAFIRQDPWLSARTKVGHFHKTIFDLETGSAYACLSREAKTKLGLNPSFVIYDEYGQSPDDDLYRALDTAMGARASPLMMVISTQAADDAAPLSRLIDYGRKVRAKEIKDPSFHLSLHCADSADDPWSEATWKKANPALGDFRSIEDVRRLAAQAQRMPGQRNSFLNLILNLRVSAHVPFVDQAAWKACSGRPNLQHGAKAFAALDLGSTRDMSALMLVLPDVDGVLHVLPHFWLPGDPHEREGEDRAPYREWISQDHLIPIGETTDPRVIAEKIAELNGQFRIQTLAFDPWRIGDVRRELDAIGCGVQVVPHSQGFKDMSPAVDILERLIIQKKIRHGNHPVLTWNAASAVVTRDSSGNRKLDKAKSQSRIDGLVALAMAVNIAMTRPAPPVFDVEALIA